MLTINVLTVVTLIVSCIADKQPIITGDLNDYDTDQCLENEEVADICLKCSSFPFYAISIVDKCCSDEISLRLCQACVKSQDLCKTLMEELEELELLSENTNDDDYYYDNIDDSEESDKEKTAPDYFYMDHVLPVPKPIDKRFGKLLVNTSPKRFGELLFGKRSDRMDDYSSNEIGKRFGRIFMGRGSYFGKRNDMDKDNGKLFTEWNRYFGKRASFPMNNDLQDYDDDELDLSKRYGRLYVGSGPKKQFGKRYGRIFFGKRSDKDTKGKYGTWGIGGTRYIDRQYPSNTNIDKRYGRLFTGRSGYNFGK